jgi:hypothetical protein
MRSAHRLERAAERFPIRADTLEQGACVGAARLNARSKCSIDTYSSPSAFASFSALSKT